MNILTNLILLYDEFRITREINFSKMFRGISKKQMLTCSHADCKVIQLQVIKFQNCH